jgi:hypothetical protein
MQRIIRCSLAKRDNGGNSSLLSTEESVDAFSGSADQGGFENYPFALDGVITDFRVRVCTRVLARVSVC